eukprot:TRINITY_DN17792_c0_g1_i1.p1 TRINITY_DN17792_c0_g1~~TRINITY_DN17792_c0_g1_i1.p1  ORF type:complete len:260 (-),score=52.13 TRINITY_DN17792_c0_g1_i1:108-887(-)
MLCVHSSRLSYSEVIFVFFFFNDTATTEIYTRSIVGSVRCVQETVSTQSTWGSANTYADRCKLDRMLSGKMKVFIVGEFGINKIKMFKDLLETVVTDGVSGAMIWSLRPHNKAGGYYKHHEGKTTYYSYHWPGFEENNSYEELEVVKLMRFMAFKIQNKIGPAIPVPDPPILLSIKNVKTINWRGSVGARSYNIERAMEPKGPFTIIASDVKDCKQIETEGPLFSDNKAEKGKKYYYRVQAKNESGASAWSNIVGPVEA